MTGQDGETGASGPSTSSRKSGAAARPAAKRSTPISRAAGKPAAGKPSARKPGAGNAGAGATLDHPADLELFVLRHADAGDPARWTGEDADRPLSNKGRRQAKRLGRLLKDLGSRPDVVLTSPKLRASDTARLVARSIGARTSTDDRLAVEFGPKELAGLVAGLEPTVRRVMIVGHDPDFSEIASWLVGCPIEMRKGALVRIDLADRGVDRGVGSLRWLLPPDAVPG